MSPKVMIWISVILSGVAQIFLKQGMAHLGGVPTQERRRPLSLAIGVVTEKFIWFWGIAFAAAMALWLVGLQHVDLSYAYPLVSVGYVVVSILAAAFLGEHVDRNRWLAIGVIGLGVWMIAGS